MANLNIAQQLVKNFEHFVNGIPELDNPTGLIRIPQEIDVPVTSRVLRILDTPAMQRLKRISQLGLVAQVYPGARHSRFEHSLGVFALARQVFQQLAATCADYVRQLDQPTVRTFLLAALVHDVGHWPYCHPIEDMGLEFFPKHESLARQLICSGEMAEVIRSDWQVAPEQVADFLAGTDLGRQNGRCNVLQNILNGPLDIDKMDYLQRDSLHAGVPYGRNFDLHRLIGSFCLNDDCTALAITDKGKTAAEMMVFARYAMFSEVYWHHTVRSATAMLQRLVFALSDRCQPLAWLEQSDADFGASMLQLATEQPHLKQLASSLFGVRRSLYKRLAQYAYADAPEIHAALAHRPYHELVRISERLSEELSSQLSAPLRSAELLLDAPPQKLEVQFRIPVRVGPRGADLFVSLEEISPVVKALATQQFDNHVKRVRLYIAPHRLGEINVTPIDLTRILLRLAEN